MSGLLPRSERFINGRTVKVACLTLRPLPTSEWIVADWGCAPPVSIIRFDRCDSMEDLRAMPLVAVDLDGRPLGFRRFSEGAISVTPVVPLRAGRLNLYFQCPEGAETLTDPLATKPPPDSFYGLQRPAIASQRYPR